MKRIGAALLIGLSSLVPVSGAGAAPPPNLTCTAPADATTIEAKLPNTARAVRTGKDLVVVAIGSSSTEGVGASDRRHSYPAQFGSELQRQWPRLSVKVINKGVGGEDAEDMLSRFSRDVMPYRPQLVIWQLGSNYVLRESDMEDFADLIRAGVNRLRTGRTDVILMNPQYAPMVLKKPVYRQVLQTIRDVADDLGVPVFERFAVMHHWISSGQARLEDMLSSDELHMNDSSYACIARLLAKSVDAAAQATPLAPLPKPSEPVKAVASGR